MGRMPASISAMPAEAQRCRSGAVPPQLARWQLRVPRAPVFLPEASAPGGWSAHRSFGSIVGRAASSSSFPLHPLIPHALSWQMLTTRLVWAGSYRKGPQVLGAQCSALCQQNLRLEGGKLLVGGWYSRLLSTTRSWKGPVPPTSKA